MSRKFFYIRAEYRNGLISVIRSRFFISFGGFYAFVCQVALVLDIWNIFLVIYASYKVLCVWKYYLAEWE